LLEELRCAFQRVEFPAFNVEFDEIDAANIRFGQPSRDGHPFLNLFYPTDIFPFTDIGQTDPETGLSDGILVKAEQAQVAPKIFYTNSSYEYWGRSASLIHTGRSRGLRYSTT
jgi:hypothetical protein